MTNYKTDLVSLGDRIISHFDLMVQYSKQINDELIAIEKLLDAVLNSVPAARDESVPLLSDEDFCGSEIPTAGTDL